MNGEHTHPLYSYLKAQLPGLLGQRIKWNFSKFLINRMGQPIKRYSPITKPEKLNSDIEKVLANAQR